MKDITAITIDGPVASGKTVIGGLVAHRLGIRFLDTGSMYRAITLVALDRGVDLNNTNALTGLAETINLSLSMVDGREHLMIGECDLTNRLRLDEVEHGVSLVAKNSGVRKALVIQQRRIADDGPIVMVGRDIGTRVLPYAQVKLYLTASQEVRVNRRHSELMHTGDNYDRSYVEEEIARRDKIDSERSDSPLKPASDAIVIDTGHLGIEQLTKKILDLISLD